MTMSERKFANFTWNDDRKWFLCNKCNSVYCIETLKIEPDRTVAVMLCQECDSYGREDVVNRSTLFVYRPMNLRPLTESDVKFSLAVAQDDTPLKEGLPDPDHAELREEIARRLNRDDVWAWCEVTITASWKDEEGEDHLCGCSYEDEADFVKTSGYYEDMKKRALDDLNAKLRTKFEALRDLVA